MNLNPFKKPSALPRCAHLSPSGRQCSQPVCSSSPSFCFTHAPKAPSPPSDASTFAAELVEAAGDLSSPADVNRVLVKIFHGLAKDRIPVKKAGTMCYILQTTLLSQRAIADQQELKKEAEEEADEKGLQEARQLSWRRTLANIPRPNYDTPREPVTPPTDPVAPTANASNSLLVEGQREGTASAVPKSLENLEVLTPEVSAASS